MTIRTFVALVAPFAMLGQTQELKQEIKQEVRRTVEQEVQRTIVQAVGDGVRRGLEAARGPQAHIQFIAAEGGFTASLNPVKGAPYTSEGTNEFTQTLADGTRITRKSISKMARDSEGRTRSEQENAVIGPVPVPGGALPTIMIHDPVARETIILDQKEKVARRMKLPSIPDAGGAKWQTKEGDVHIERNVIIHHAAPGAGGTFNVPAPPPAGGVMIAHRGEPGQKESLGKQTIAGLVCDGTRMTNTIPAGQIGNDRPIQIVTESWYSPELKLTVMTRTQDPLHGESTFRLHSVTRGEPAKSLFQIPADYSVKDGAPGVMMRQRIEKK